jgi:hypothetical protein
MVHNARKQFPEVFSHWGVQWCLWRLTASLVLLVLTPILPVAQGAVSTRPSPQVKQEIATLLQETLPQFDINPQRLPGRFRRQVIRRVYEYTVLYRTDVQAMLQRAAPYLPMIQRTLRQHGLPTYFAYIPLVESAFHIDAAHPQSGARGLWQLMPATARGFGLQVSSHVDERLDPWRATQAAARYLQKLQERFGLKAPLYVLAAYNHGDTNLARTMRRTRIRDIWRLYIYRRLPYQTREYLIKMVTLWVVVAHAARFELVSEYTTPPQMVQESALPQTIPLGIQEVPYLLSGFKRMPTEISCTSSPATPSLTPSRNATTLRAPYTRM